ncbi:DNA primase [Rosettibacter firmus]|uniref:DNA primase n=1 Tax=Rosettibacter firmus TaxID=3111522 RepID=UPI00336BB5D1
MKISEQKIEEIRSAVDIVDIISGYVHLRKRGKNFVGLCPFHHEKTPSFTVSGEKQIYHCFGCGAGGNVFKFLMDFKNISFKEAVEEIAEYAGIKIQYEKSELTGIQKELEELYEINVFAARYFVEILNKSPDAEEARLYLKKRNIKPQTQKIFGIGFAPFGWDNFLKAAKDNGIDLNKARALGLIDINEKGEYYDKFRGRIIFPIFSPNGRVIAFGGRILVEGENVAKYLNSPESQIYSKRKSLYGLFHSKEEIRKLDKAILVEGYLDLISLYQAGIKNVVASSGTSLTEEQVQLLSRFTKNVVLLFDADVAGQKASLRSIEILLKQDFDIKIMTLPKGEDPDSFINKFGKEKFEELISSAKDIVEYQTSQYESEGKFNDPSTATMAIREIVKTLALVNDELKRSLLIKSIVKKFGLRERVIEDELKKFLDSQQGKTIPQNLKTTSSNIIYENNISSFADITNISSYEKEIIRLLYSGNENIVEYILEKISPDHFTNPDLKYLVNLVVEGYNDKNISPAYLIDKITNDRLKNFIFKLTMTEEAISQKWDEFSLNGKIEKDSLEYAIETVLNFLIYQIEQEIKSNIKIMENTKDEHLHIELLNRNKELLNEKKILLNQKVKK